MYDQISRDADTDTDGLKEDQKKVMDACRSSPSLKPCLIACQDVGYNPGENNQPNLAGCFDKGGLPFVVFDYNQI